MKKQNTKKDTHKTMHSPYDVNGSYTGTADDNMDIIQDTDDL